MVHGAPFRVGFTIAAGFDLKDTAAHGTLPAQGDVGGMRGGDRAHVSHLGGLAHRTAFRGGEFHAGGLHLVGALVHVAKLPKLGARDFVPGKAQEFIATPSFGPEISFQLLQPFVTCARRCDGRARFSQGHVDQLRFGHTGEVGEDALANEELGQRGFVAKTKFGGTHIWLNCVPPQPDLATEARNATTVATSSLMQPGSGVKVGATGTRFQAICGAISDLAPPSGAKGVRWNSEPLKDCNSLWRYFENSATDYCKRR